jgi:hypothetical protein
MIPVSTENAGRTKTGRLMRGAALLLAWICIGAALTVCTAWFISPCMQVSPYQNGRASQVEDLPSHLRAWWPTPSRTVICHLGGLGLGIVERADVHERASGRSSPSPLHRRSNESIVASSGESTPLKPVNCSATWKGCDRNRSILRARAHGRLSSSESSSTPRIAMMSCRSL